MQAKNTDPTFNLLALDNNFFFKIKVYFNFIYFFFTLIPIFIDDLSDRKNLEEGPLPITLIFLTLFNFVINFLLNIFKFDK